MRFPSAGPRESDLVRLVVGMDLFFLYTNLGDSSSGVLLQAVLLLVKKNKKQRPYGF